MAAENNSWLIFLRFLCEERSGEATRESGLYKLIIEHFPIQFMQKLLSTAVDNSIAQSDRVYAAAVIKEMNAADIVERNYSNIEPQSLEALRRHALDLTVGYRVDTALQKSGQELTLKLLRESLKAGQVWDEFLEFAMEGFAQISVSAADDLDRFLALFRGLALRLQHKLVRIMKPRILRHSAEFEGTVRQLLHEAEDETPFLLLPCIIRTFDHMISPAITQAAITSQFLADFDGMQPTKALQVAEILTQCIEYTDLITHPFPFSFDDFQIMDGIAGSLAQFLEDSAVSVEYPEVALHLLETMVVKFEAYYSDGNEEQEQEEEEEHEQLEEEEEPNEERELEEEEPSEEQEHEEEEEPNEEQEEEAEDEDEDEDEEDDK